MDDHFSVSFTAIATGLLAVIGIAQAMILFGQRRQQRLDWAEIYRKRWNDNSQHLAKVVYFGREHGSFYQLADEETLKQCHALIIESDPQKRNLSALSSVRIVFGILSDICQRIMQGQLKINEAYPIFGTEFLRHGAALRALLDYSPVGGMYGRMGPTTLERMHDQLRDELHTWLVCHDGIRRRSLIMIDLLWAEAARLEDLPPEDIRTAADAKVFTGKSRRKRLKDETIRLNGWRHLIKAERLAYFLRHSEYKKFKYSRGIDRKRLNALSEEWDKRYLRNY